MKETDVERLEDGVLSATVALCATRAGSEGGAASCARRVRKAAGVGPLSQGRCLRKGPCLHELCLP